MRRFVLLLFWQAFSGPHAPSRRVALRCAFPRAGVAGPGHAACRRAWGEIRARYRLKDLAVPA